MITDHTKLTVTNTHITTVSMHIIETNYKKRAMCNETSDLLMLQFSYALAFSILLNSIGKNIKTITKIMNHTVRPRITKIDAWIY